MKARHFIQKVASGKPSYWIEVGPNNEYYQVRYRGTVDRITYRSSTTLHIAEHQANTDWIFGEGAKYLVEVRGCQAKKAMR